MKKQQKQRARWIWLTTFTAVALIAMLVVQTRAYSSLPTVTTVVVQPTTVKETVVCGGNVRVAQGIEVIAPVPCVAGDVAVAVGDRVEKGDILLRIDRAATLAAAMSAGASEAQLSTASAALPEAVVAPQAGVVSAVNAAAGEIVSNESPCVVLSEGGAVEIALAVRESMLPQLAVGQAVTVSGVAFAQESYNGTLSYIADSARSRVSGTTTETVVDAVVTLPVSQIDESLLPGLTAKAAVVTAVRDNVIVVPYEAVISDETGEAVYCEQNGVAFRRAVTVGKELAQGVEIVGGLQAGERVVTDAAALDGLWIAVDTKGAA